MAQRQPGPVQEHFGDSIPTFCPFGTSAFGDLGVQSVAALCNSGSQNVNLMLLTDR